MASNINKSLNTILADYAIYNQKLRNYHWNVKGELFLVLHAKFECLYEKAAKHIDELAERILAVGGNPLSNLSDYLEVARLKEDNGHPNAMTMVSNLKADISKLVESLKEAAEEAEKADDSVTASMLEDFIEYHQKTLWMLSASLAK